MESLHSLLPAHWPADLRNILSPHAVLDSIAPAPVARNARRQGFDAIQRFSLSEWRGASPTHVRLLRALIFYAADALEECHQIFQEVESFVGSYGHGMMHRREGDFWNANYWFRHAGTPPAAVFDAGFQPVKLTTECQAFFQSPRASQQPVVEKLRAEWICVTDALLAGHVA